MKKLLVTLLVVGACAFTSLGQTNTVTSDGTNVVDGTFQTVPNLLGSLFDTVVNPGLTNLSVAMVGTYTPKLEEWGASVVVMRNIPLGGGISTGVGLGVDYYAQNFYAVNGQLALQATTRPFAQLGGFFTNVIFTPFTFGGIGTPIGSEASGSLETILAVGGTIHVMKLLGGSLDVMGMYGTREGIGEASGAFYGGGLVNTWKF